MPKRATITLKLTVETEDRGVPIEEISEVVRDELESFGFEAGDDASVFAVTNVEEA